MVDLEEYNNGDKITCLECGKSYQEIGGAHLRSTHNMLPQEYKDKYGLPYNYSLACKNLRDKRSASAIRNMDNIHKARSVSDPTKKRKSKGCSNFKKKMLQERIVIAQSCRTKESHRNGAEKNTKLTPEQEDFIIKNCGTHSFTDILIALEISSAMLTRVKKKYDLKFPRRPVIRGADGKVTGRMHMLVTHNKKQPMAAVYDIEVPHE